jgi:menaquinone-specific isochorismate synthase
VIEEIEGMNRGRYAGPVGWVDARGDGELGIALRSGQINQREIRIFAGCGIVAGSDPDVEVAESNAKFAAMRSALN